DGQSAASPALDQSSPVLFLAGIAGLAVRHGQDLRDRGKNDHVPKVITGTRTGPTGRLLPLPGRAALARPDRQPSRRQRGSRSAARPFWRTPCLLKRPPRLARRLPFSFLRGVSGGLRAPGAATPARPLNPWPGSSPPPPPY